jgi:hypothetical protein
MQKMQFQTIIAANPKKVWDILWNDESYREWTSVFSEGSKAETDWEEGSKVLFLDGKGQGMVSMIAAKRPVEFMSFRHLGVVKDGVEDTTSPEVKEWAGSTENYTLADVNGGTELTVEMDLSEQWKEYFEKTFPKALDKIKEIAERVTVG